MNKIIILITSALLIGCVKEASIHTTGDTINLTNFNGVLSLNTNSVSGNLKNNPILKPKIESTAAESLNKKYNSITSYDELLKTATSEELKLTVHKVLQERGFTHLLVSTINPVQSKTTTSSRYDETTGTEKTSTSVSHSMDISCTVYRLSDGKAISHANADAYSRDKGYWSRFIDNSILGTETDVDRWELGVIYSCDEALKALIR